MPAPLAPGAPARNTPFVRTAGTRSTSTVWTHVIGGLSENDFILPGEIDALPR